MNDSDLLALLETFMAAFNAHDAGALVDCMTEDCVFYAAAGPDERGAALRGKDAVRAGFEAIWRRCPDAAWTQGEHAVCGNRGFSEWLFTGTPVDGAPATSVRGVDMFTFADGKIQVKDTFRKQRS